MFRIGEFSRIARVSCRLLRYYEQRGLLRPRSVDPQSGYRYYDAAQLAELNRLLVLKELGLTLDQIARAIEEDLSPAQMRSLLVARRDEATQTIAQESARLRRLEARIAELESDAPVDNDDIVYRSEPAFDLLSMRRTVSSFDEARGLVASLIEQVPKRVGRTHLGRFIVIVHSEEFEPDEIDAELGFVLTGRLREPAIVLDGGVELRVRRVEAVAHLATCVRRGPPEVAHATTALLGRRIAADGFTLAGPNRELFLQRPRPDALSDVVVEMQFPVVRRAD